MCSVRGWVRLAGSYKVISTCKAAGIALQRLLVNGPQVQQVPWLTIVPGEAASDGWVNAPALSSGMSATCCQAGRARAAYGDAAVRPPHHHTQDGDPHYWCDSAAFGGQLVTGVHVCLSSR